MADTWQAISGYASNNYSDTMVFEVDGATKKLQKISGQTLIAGEKNSQYIRFMMPRYWDGIDVSEKTISIIYGLAGQYYGETAAISAERTDDSLRFGWVVPEEACCIAGTLLFILVIKDSTYVLKSQITEVPVLKSINLDDVIPEPTRETWYRDFQVRIEQTLSAAENAVEVAQNTLEQARSLIGSPLVANTAEEMTDTSRIYVYTGSETGYTNGHWYYHNGSAWTDGGVYNAVAVDTDTTLSISGKAADAKKTGDEIEQIKEDLQDLRYAYEIPLRRCYFVRKAWMNSSNGFVDDNSRATNSIPITINSPVKIVSDNANVQFAIMQNSSYILDDWTDSVELSGLDGAYINMRVVSGAEMTGTLVDALHIYTTETGYKEFVQNYTYTIKNTDRFPSYSEYVGVNRYATDLSANNVGCLLRNSSVQSSTFPFICDKDVTVWVGRYNGQTLTVIIDGVATTISEGKSFTIPANTYFTCYWNASAGSKSECTMYVTEYEVGERLLNPTMAGSQMLTNATTSMSVDTSFMVGDKVFMLAQETGGYAVKNGNAFTKSAQSIGNTLGHANSCNYHNGKVYVSDWRDNPNTIYVLTVDTDQDTLTYEKTLTVPLVSGRGSTEYFVFDDEKQIYFVGWKTGAAGTDPNTLMYGLYVLTTTGYELAWERQAVRPLILQSAIVHKHYIYIMECQMDYKTVGISRINMLTGEMEHNACTMAGSFVTYEGEGLTPIGDHAFVTSDHNGRTYFIGFSPKAR